MMNNSKVKQQEPKPAKAKKAASNTKGRKKTPEEPQARDLVDASNSTTDDAVPDFMQLVGDVNGGSPWYNFDGGEDQHWTWLRSGVVDEQMSWGCSWLPSCDVEYMGQQALNDMYNDVMWVDDLWNLRSMDNRPTQ